MEEYNGKYEGLCPTCIESRRCETWAEWKCVKLQRRYLYAGPKTCPYYTKRPLKWEEMRCRCEDCLRNEKLSEGVVE